MISGPRSGPGPATTCQMSFGKPASSSSCAREQRGQHGLRVRLGDDGVAGEQRGEAVAERHRERVVPGADDADDALGHPVDLDPGQAGYDAELALRVEVLVRGAAVVAGGQRDVQRLVERVLPGLAGLPHDQVDDLVLAVEHQVVQPQQALRALVDADLAPRLLRLAGLAERLGHVDRRALRDVGERSTVERRLDRRRSGRCSPRCDGSGSRRSRVRARTPPAGRARDRPAPRPAVRLRVSERSWGERRAA